MNILFNTFTGLQGSEVVRQLIKTYTPENCICIIEEEKYISEFRNLFSIVFSYRDAFSCNFEKFPHVKECLPIDEYLIKSMEKYENTIIKMMERNHTHSLDYDSRKRIYFKHLRYWNYILDIYNIDYFVCFNIPHEIFDYLIYCLCKVKGIRVIASYISPIMEYSYLVEDIESPCPEIAIEYKKLLLEYKDSDIDEISLSGDFNSNFEKYINTNNDITPYYMKSKSRPWAKDIKRPLIYLKKLIINTKKNKIKIALNKLRYIFSNIRLSRQLNNYYDKHAQEVDLGQKYIYAPLHFQPECTTCPMGGVYVYQYLYIEMISYYLPEGVLIYVKEHPMQKLLGRDLKLYKDLLRMHNVRLVPRQLDTYTLLDNCIAVASVTGTAGFEGLFRNKPFLMFGSFINQYAPGVYNIRNNEDCRKALSEVLNKKDFVSIKELKIYMAALERVTFHGYYDDGSYNTDYPINDNIKCTFKAFKNKIDRTLNNANGGVMK